MLSPRGGFFWSLSLLHPRDSDFLFSTQCFPESEPFGKCRPLSGAPRAWSYFRSYLCSCCLWTTWLAGFLLPLALPSGTSCLTSSSPRGGLGRKGCAVRQNAARKTIPHPHYLEIIGSIIISQFSLQIFAQQIQRPQTQPLWGNGRLAGPQMQINAPALIPMAFRWQTLRMFSKALGNLQIWVYSGSFLVIDKVLICYLHL